MNNPTDPDVPVFVECSATTSGVIPDFPEEEEPEKDTPPINLLETLLNATELHFSCPICNELFTKPLTISCGHTFCTSCIHGWFKTKENCPVCREPTPEEPKAETVLNISDYLKCVRPILHHYRLENDELPSPDCDSDNGQIFSEEMNEVLMNHIGESLASIKNEKDWNTINTAVTILSSAIYNGFSLDEILADVKERQLPLRELLEKYDVPSPRIPRFEEDAVVPRTTGYNFVWPWDDVVVQVLLWIAFFGLLYEMVCSTNLEELMWAHVSYFRSLCLVEFYVRVIRPTDD